MTEHPNYSKFYRAMADHYRVERTRSETVLSDIVGILSGLDNAEMAVAAILDRLTQHYDRSV